MKDEYLLSGSRNDFGLDAVAAQIKAAKAPVVEQFWWRVGTALSNLAFSEMSEHEAREVKEDYLAGFRAADARERLERRLGRLADFGPHTQCFLYRDNNGLMALARSYLLDRLLNLFVLLSWFQSAPLILMVLMGEAAEMLARIIAPWSAPPPISAAPRLPHISLSPRLLPIPSAHASA